MPKFSTADKLGDFTKKYTLYHTETDIKTKVLFLGSNPKGYNIDKVLEFLSLDKAVYMIYLLGVNDDGKIVANLCSFIDRKLLDSTKIQHHWAGRNTRGVTQFIGSGLKEILDVQKDSCIDINKAKMFLNELMNK